MSYFYGAVQGSHGEISGTGSKSSGIEAAVASWQGAVYVRLWHNAEDDKDHFEVRLEPWMGNIPSNTGVLSSGIIDDSHTTHTLCEEL